MTIKTRHPGAPCGEPRSLRLCSPLFVLVLMALAATALLAPAAMAQSRGAASDPLALLAVQQAELTASDGAAQNYFGFSVALSGDTAVVGANGKQFGAGPPEGAAYVFVRSGGAWSEQAELTASDGGGGDSLGWSVALSGDTALVGAPAHQVGANEWQGAAYAFVRSGAAWSQQGGALTASDGAAEDYFGISVALSGDTALVGAPVHQVGANEAQGAAYAFVRSGAAWSQQGGALSASDGAANDYFGDSVALAGDAALIGAPRGRYASSAAHGAAYRFVRSGAVWSQNGDALTASDGAVVDGFGHGVAVSGDVILVGAPYKQIGANEKQGAAYVFPPSTSLDLAYQLNYRPAGIDPLFADDPQAFNVVDALFDGLTSLDSQTSAVLPAVASSWKASAKVTVWTFRLRPGARFSNGARVTAQDFKFTWERLFRSASKDWGGFLLSNVKGSAALAAGRAKHLSGVVAENRTTLVVKLKTPFADFPSTVADPSLAPVPRGLLSTAKKARRYHNAPVGNGPFVLAEPWNGKDTVSLAPAPGYYGAAPHIAGLTFTVIEDPAAAYAQFQAGALDVANFPAASLAEVEAAYGTSVDGVTAEPGHQVVPGPIDGAMWTVFNTKKAPLNDVLVRRAFSLALDRAQLSATQPIAGYFLTPASDVLPPGMPGYVPGQWLYAQLDLVQAAALLAEAGFPGGVGLPAITFLTVNQATKSEYATDLAAIGVEVRFVEVSREEFLLEWESGNYMMMQDGWNWYPTAAAALYNGFYGPLGGSESFYNNPAVNAALRRACAIRNDAARLAAFQSIDAMIAADVPVTPISYFNRPVVCSARLHDAVLSPMNLFDFTKVRIE